MMVIFQGENWSSQDIQYYYIFDNSTIRICFQYYSKKKNYKKKISF